MVLTLTSITVPKSEFHNSFCKGWGENMLSLLIKILKVYYLVDS